jgi:uncharacterized protein YdeI (YjbR/CyaY-like superfamily)
MGKRVARKRLSNVGGVVPCSGTTTISFDPRIQEVPMATGKQTGSNPGVDRFLAKAGTWQEELRKLRSICLECRLTEELKWGKPCYTFQNHNIVILQGFKDFCAVLFPKGALLKDARGILQEPGANTQAGRRIPFTDEKSITRVQSALKAYIREAIELEKAGRKVDMKKTAAYVIADEFRRHLDSKPALKSAFEALTPGRQRAYLLHFSAPKQSRTRESRVVKCTPRILAGKGLNDV